MSWILVCLKAFGSTKFNQGNYEKTDVIGISQDISQKLTGNGGHAEAFFFWDSRDSSKNNNFRTVDTIFSRIVVKFVKLSIFSAHHSGKTLFYNSEI